MKKNNNKIISIKADIHPDGDVYIKHKGVMYRIGQLDSENLVSEYPNLAYIKTRKLLKR